MRSAHTRARSRSYPPARKSPRFGVGRREIRHLDVRRVLELGDSGSRDQRDAREKERGIAQAISLGMAQALALGIAQGSPLTVLSLIALRSLLQFVGSII